MLHKGIISGKFFLVVFYLQSHDYNDNDNKIEKEKKKKTTNKKQCTTCKVYDYKIDYITYNITENYLFTQHYVH